MKSCVVIGLGQFGRRLASQLFDMGCDVLAIDTDGKAVQMVADHVTRAVTADAKNREVLKRLGVEECDSGIITIGSDLSASALITMNLQALGVPEIICKAKDETNGEVLEKLGADKVIIPEQDMAMRLAKSLVTPNILETITLSKEFGMIEMKVPEDWVGHTLGELNIRARYDINIIAVKQGETVRVSPTAQYRFDADNIMIILGHYNSLNKFERMVQ